MYSKNVIAVTAALVLGRAAAYPAQLIDRDNQEKNVGPWDIKDNSPSCKYDPRLGWIGTYCAGGEQNGVYGYGVRLEGNPAYYTFNDGDIQRGHSDKGYFSKTADGKYTIDWSRNQIAETGEKLDPLIYGPNPYNGIFKRDVAGSGRRQPRSRNLRPNEPESRAVEMNSDNALAARDDQAQQEALAKHMSEIVQAMETIKANHEDQNAEDITEEQARNQWPSAFTISGGNPIGPDATFYGYGFQPKKSGNGYSINLGYDQLNYNGNGYALQTLYGTYDLSRNKWADNRPNFSSLQFFNPFAGVY